MSMIRLNNRQLHIVLGVLVIASILIGGLLVISKDESVIVHGELSTLDNISDGWVASYETLDETTWRQFGNTNDINAKWNITEVLNLPNTFKVSQENEVMLSHKIPDFNEEKLYLVFTSKGQQVEIRADNNVIYEMTDEEISFPYHIVSVDYQYRNGNLTFKVRNDNDNRVSIGEVKIGTYTELMSDAFRENGGFVIFGIFLIIVSIGLFVICVFIKTKKADRNKKLMLIYSSFEAFLTGLLFIVHSRIFRIVINWEMINYYIRSCMFLIVGVSHLIVVRCLIRRKKILTVVDIGVAFNCIMFVSVMVLQWFGLLTFDTIYIICLSLLGIEILVYTLLLGSASYDYRQHEGIPVFIANILLVIAGVIELILYITGSSKVYAGLPLIAGCFMYFIIIWNYGLNRAAFVDASKETEDNNISIIREQVIEELNPNLLFASFKSLQNMIKAESENSTKMIYYISVYLMDNIKAMNNRGDIISFDEELEHIMAYLQLQKMRNNNLSFVVEAKVRGFKVPRNSLEPMVENAVKYGVGGKSNRGNVVVRTYERRDGYAIQIIDDGIGFDPSRLKKQSPTALKNLCALLEEKCMAKTEIISKEGKGTVITAVLPMIDNELM